MRFPKPYADVVQRFRVPGGFLLLAAFVWLAQPTSKTILAGLPLCGAGLFIRAWAAGHLRKNEQLTRSGPYAYVRNPLYVGSLLLAGGMVVAANSTWMALVFLATFVLVYLPVIQLEEQHLRSLFPEYAEYARQVPSLIPRLGTRNSPSHRASFCWRLYRRNKEWRALLGFLFGLAWLLWKLTFTLSSQAA
ncbi:MAG: isoprenylcysteine carboxylmethyltransferase family protein [Bryobacteraceae bacterium]|nr:isoprenylcysteine carboxylmethyltransferase family protein [Bryobacteraceae bacterium]MDW8376568.1 isoprenylcysteine carboxylmethyltransferase family protein [Bryobacterales bacterium]